MDGNVPSTSDESLYADIDFTETTADSGIPVTRGESTTSYITHQASSGGESTSDSNQQAQDSFENDYDPFTTSEDVQAINSRGLNPNSRQQSKSSFNNSYDPFTTNELSTTNENAQTVDGRDFDSTSIRHYGGSYHDNPSNLHIQSEGVQTVDENPFNHRGSNPNLANEVAPNIVSTNFQHQVATTVVSTNHQHQAAPTIVSTNPQYRLPSHITLYNSIKMPHLQLGVHYADKETHVAVLAALHVGYRGFDTSQRFSNIGMVGNAIRQFLDSRFNTNGVKRGDFWFTTKLANCISYDDTRKAIRSCVLLSRLDYIDLILLEGREANASKRLECWAAIVDAVGAGEIRAGGVTNWGIKHFREIHAIQDPRARWLPLVNQLEVNPFIQRRALTDFCFIKGIVVQAYRSIAREKMNHPVLMTLAARHSCTVAQVLLRWSIQCGFVPLPRSLSIRRIAENIHVEHFHIPVGEMVVLNGLNEHTECSTSCPTTPKH